MANIAFANGTAPEQFVDNIDSDDPEYKRQLLRPAEIKEDITLVSGRRRVSLALNSASFKKELEEIVETFTRSNDSTGLNSSLLSLQHLTDLLSTVPGKRPMTGGGFSNSSRSGVIPINDLRGAEAGLYSRREHTLRCKLASVYRLIELFGWNTSIHNHATVRLSPNEEHFLINPFGLLNHEVTASSLIKVDIQGAVLDPGSTVLGVHQTGWQLHSAVHSARPSIRCVIHLGTPATIAVSCMKTGLLPISQEAIILGKVVYYNPIAVTPTSDLDSPTVADTSAERLALSQLIEHDTHILFVRCRGLLALGETIEEAWHYATNAVIACETQLRLASLGEDNLVLPSQNVQKRAYDAWRTTEAGGVSSDKASLAIRLAHARSLSPTRAQQGPPVDGYFSDTSITALGGQNGVSSRPWRLGELEFEALMRHLDNGGYRTGHLYRQEAAPNNQRLCRTLDRAGASTLGTHRHDDVEIPPFTSSAVATMTRYNDESGAFSGDESEAPRSGTLRREWSDHKWLNTPNVYTKKTFTRPGRQPVSYWVSDQEETLHSEISEGRLPPPAPFRPLTPAAIPLGTIGGLSATPTSAFTYYNRFAPQGSDPKEFQDQHKRVKAKYYHDINTAGPQSRLLDELNWEEARRIRDDVRVKTLGSGAVTSPVTVASKAVLQRDIRDDAVVYGEIYVRHNPFEQVTDEELEAYKRGIEKKKNEPTHDAEGGQIDKQMCSPVLDGDASQLSPPVAAEGTTASELDKSHATEKKQKKKRRFMPLSLARKSRNKEKKIKEPAEE